MKKLLSLVVSIVIISLVCSSVGAINVSSTSVEKDFSNASVNLIDLDDWQESDEYKNATISKELDKNYSLKSFKADIINVSSDELTTEDTDYIIQLVDDGATLLIQNQNGMYEYEEICELVGISAEKNYVNIDENNLWMNIGYSVKNGENGYKIEPIFATVMKSQDDETFDLESELKNLKNSESVYIDPIDFYCSIKENNTVVDESVKPLNLNKAFQSRASNQFESFDAYGFLYGKNRDAKWGITSGYTEVAYVEFGVKVVPKFNNGNYKYDAVECIFTLTGSNNKYIDSYIAINEVYNDTCYMAEYTYLNEQSKKIYTTEYTWTTEGPQSSFSVATEVNPAAQTIYTAKTLNKVAWTCTPNSHLNGQTWQLNAGCLTKTLSGNSASVGVGLDNLVVDNWGFEYTSPCPLIMTISYQR